MPPPVPASCLLRQLLVTLSLSFLILYFFDHPIVVAMVNPCCYRDGYILHHLLIVAVKHIGMLQYPPLSINNLTSLVFISYYFKNIDFRLSVHQGRADMPPTLHSSSPQLGCGVSPIEASVLFAFDIPLTRRLWNLDFHILSLLLPIRPLTDSPLLQTCVCTSYKASVPDGLSYPCGLLTCLLRNNSSA